MMGVGLLIEENLQEIVGRFHAAVGRELGFEEPSLKLAAPILLHDIARAMRSPTATTEPGRRALVLMLSQPEGGIRGLVREFALLRHSLWETLALRRRAFLGSERRQVDLHLDETLAAASERWAGFVRLLSPVTRASPKLPPLRTAKATSVPPPPLPARKPSSTRNRPEPTPS